MSNCSHKDVTMGAYGSAYCTSCGERITVFPPPSGAAYLPPPSGPMYWSAMEDSRKLRWHELAKGGFVIETGRVYIGTRWDDKTGVWLLGRVRFCEDCNQWEVEQALALHQCAHEEAWISHIAEDALGTPACTPRSPAPVTRGLANPHNVR